MFTQLICYVLRLKMLWVDKRIGFELIIETALGMQNINEIAAYP